MASGILTAKQEAFAQHYAATRDGSASYRKAYEVSDTTTAQSVSIMAAELIANTKVASRVTELIDEATRVAGFTVTKLTDMFLDMATADRNELVGLRVGCCRHCYGEAHNYQWRMREYLKELEETERFNVHAKPAHEKPLPDPSGGFDFNATRAPVAECPECHGEGIERTVARDTTKLSRGAQLLYGGVKRTRNGPEIVIADRAKALESLARVLGAFDHEQNVRLSGALTQAVAVINTQDPAEAAKLYEAFIAGRMA